MIKVEEIKSLLQIDLEDKTHDFVISKLIGPALDWCKNFAKRDFLVESTDLEGNPIEVELIPDGVKLAVAQMIKFNMKNLSTKKDMLEGATSISFEDFTIKYKTPTEEGVSPAEIPTVIKDLLAPYIDKSVKFI